MSDKPTYPCDANALRGHQTRVWAHDVVTAYRNRQRGNHQACPENRSTGLETPATGIVAPVLIAGRDQVTPPLMSDAERGAGDSTNARLHRLIGKYRDFALDLDKR